MGEATTHLLSGLCTLPGPASAAFPSPRLTQHPKRAWPSSARAPELSEDAPLSAGPRECGPRAGTWPSRGRPLASPLLRTRPGRPPPPSPLLTCSADTAPFPAPLPLLLPARPLLSAIFAACRASGARRGPAVRHFRPRRPPARPALPPPLGSPARVPGATVAVAACRPYPRPAGCGEFPLRSPPRERRGGRANCSVGARGGVRVPSPPPTTGRWERGRATLPRRCCARAGLS